jgi:hypothetical protein
MSKPDGKPSRSSPGASRGQGPQRRFRGNKPREKETRTLNSDQDVPMLKFGPNNNFVLFKERLATACSEPREVLDAARDRREQVLD